jgi:glucoamylase
VSVSNHRQATRRDSRKFLRPDAELRGLTGDSILGEPRFNPDGTLDILRWSRPQYDGPALRALACLRYLAAGGPPSGELSRLLDLDLDFTRRHADARCIGPWEEAGENAHHYYVALVQLGALLHGRAWAEGAGTAWRAAEDRLRAGLERHWSPHLGVYTALRDAAGESADEVIDAAVLLAVLDANLPDGPHSAGDPRVAETQAALERLFAREFPINHGLPPERAPALGRSRGDRYFGGGAWYPTTLAAAGLCYRRAVLPGQDREELLRRGDAFMASVRALTPADGALSEQVDRETGRQTSARHLTWSYAAFVSTARLRARAQRG